MKLCNCMIRLVVKNSFHVRIISKLLNTVFRFMTGLNGAILIKLQKHHQVLKFGMVIILKK